MIVVERADRESYIGFEPCKHVEVFLVPIKVEWGAGKVLNHALLDELGPGSLRNEGFAVKTGGVHGEWHV